MVVTLMPFTVLKTRMEAGREGYHSLRAGLSTMLFKDRFTSMPPEVLVVGIYAREY